MYNDGLIHMHESIMLSMWVVLEVGGNGMVKMSEKKNQWKMCVDSKFRWTISESICIPAQRFSQLSVIYQA